jgi:predicted acetyltransferase
VGEALLRATLRELRTRGDALSLLYAFRADWYAKLGWGLSEVAHLLSVPPTALPASEESRRVRKAQIPDRPNVQALYDRVAREGHFSLERRPEWWEKRLWTAGGDWVVYEGKRRGDIEGYLQYEVDSAEGPWKLVITVNEFVAATPAAHRGLWGYLHALRDQAAEIVAAVPSDNAWLSVLGAAVNQRPGVSVRTLQDAGNLGYGAMLRLVDAKAGLEALPLAPGSRGELVLEVRDAQLPANARAWRVHAREGRLHVRAETGRAGSAGARLPKLSADTAVLASIVSGALSPVRAAEIGTVEDVRGAAALIEPWFRGRPAHVHPLNAF